MRGIAIIACVLVAGSAVWVLTAGGTARHAAPESRLAGFTEPVVSAPPPAPVRGCASRISGGSGRRAGETIVGPLRFDMRPYSRPPAWRRMVRSGDWLKSPTRLRAGGQVTLVVPPEQRDWMSLRYLHRRRGTATVTLRACRHRRTPAARRRECVWAEYTACRSGPTHFSGGFEIDYEEAPQQGRCAELIVWVEGEAKPRRLGLLEVEPGECAALDARA